MIASTRLRFCRLQRPNLRVLSQRNSSYRRGFFAKADSATGSATDPIHQACHKAQTIHIATHHGTETGTVLPNMTVDFGALPELPLDEAFRLTAAFKADSHPQKVSLGAGVYRDENTQPWILPSVRQVCSSSTSGLC
jgi:hypothetical protein